MTRPSNDELKRLAVVLSDKDIDGYKMPGKTANVWAARLDALLSEIEGLKAERDGNWDEYIAERKSRMEHGAREAGYLDAIARLENRANQSERKLADLRSKAKDSWKPTRGEVINAICNSSPFGPDYKHQDLLQIADAILALRPQTAESGK